MDILEHPPGELDDVLDSGSDDFIELIPCHLYVHINTIIITVFQDSKYLNIGLFFST